MQVIANLEGTFAYSFVVNSVFFVSLDNAKYYSLYKRDIQLSWLREQLGSDIAQESVATIVYGHISYYPVGAKRSNTSTHHNNGSLEAERRYRSASTIRQNALETILLEHEVDLTVFGHAHAYYPGKVIYRDGLQQRIAFLPCVASTRRYLVNSSYKSPHSFLSIEVMEDGGGRYNAYHCDKDESARTRVDKSKLPREIPTPANAYNVRIGNEYFW